MKIPTLQTYKQLSSQQQRAIKNILLKKPADDWSWEQFEIIEYPLNANTI